MTTVTRRATCGEKKRSIKKNAEIVLEQMILTDDSTLVGQTIRESGIREKTHGIVVGIERNGQRHINPESTQELKEGDVLWIVGDRLRILSMRKK